MVQLLVILSVSLIVIFGKLGAGIATLFHLPPVVGCVSCCACCCYTAFSLVRVVLLFPAGLLIPRPFFLNFFRRARSIDHQKLRPNGPVALLFSCKYRYLFVGSGLQYIIYPGLITQKPCPATLPTNVVHYDTGSFNRSAFTPLCPTMASKCTALGMCYEEPSLNTYNCVCPSGIVDPLPVKVRFPAFVLRPFSPFRLLHSFNLATLNSIATRNS